MCTTYNITNGKPTCISINAYDTRNNANSEWSKMIELFGEENCSSGTNVVCGSHISQTLYWGCRASDDEIRCDWETNSSFNISSCYYSGESGDRAYFGVGRADANSFDSGTQRVKDEEEMIAACEDMNAVISEWNENNPALLCTRRYFYRDAKIVFDYE